MRGHLGLHVADQVTLASDGVEGVSLASASPPDVVVLDVMLPGIDGIEVARLLRRRGALPILMLTARDGVDDRVIGLDAGADDYLAKPFALEELLARLRALLRRSGFGAGEPGSGILVFADVSLDLDTRQATRAGKVLELRHKELELLRYFLLHPRRVLSRRRIFEEVWGFDFLGDSNVIEVTVAHLRQKLEADHLPRLIHTVRSSGYVLREPEAGR
jgi:two-component system response regulator MprA